ncbi:MAG: hypothetical protein BJG00_007410 [Limnothrix sp. CACIAM 69d]|nr:MAG: hypothetical protein BJG00_007410 [Limnothrix sp. CACIAM 69d]
MGDEGCELIRAGGLIPLVKNLPVDRVALGAGILIQRSIRHSRSSILMTQKPASLAAGSRNL